MMSLPAMAVSERIDRLRPAIGDVDCDALVVTSPTNIRYLTGFTGSAGTLLVTDDAVRLYTDGRYRDQAPEELDANGVTADVCILSAEVDAAIGETLDGVDRVGLEADHVTWRRQRGLAAAIAAELRPTSGLVADLRSRKDDGEVARIEAAAAAVDAGLAEVVSLLADRPTERELALELDAAVRRHGAVGPAYETIVASGPNGARPHARPSERQITTGDMVVIDVGGIVDGYRSDMTRTFSIGDPDPRQHELLELVIEAQSAGVASVGPGVVASDVDGSARRVIEDAGRGDEFSHGTGHGVGLDIHESPWINARSDTVLAEGHVLTVEPGVYVNGFAGVRIEDTVLVSSAGCRRLTNTPRTAEHLVIA